MDNLRKSFLVKGNSIVGAVGDKYFSSTAIGVIQAFSGNIIPRGFLVCNGASYKVADYPDLYAVIGNTYGGDTENFNVPDYRETVLVGVGENTTDTIASHDVYGLGEFKDDQLQRITGDFEAGNRNTSPHTSGAFSAKGSQYTWFALSETATSSSSVEFDSSKVTRSGTTTHGKQKGVTYIIKAFHTNEGTDSGVSDDVVEYVNNSNSYSTEETLTGGKWINGKPIYKKVFKVLKSELDVSTTNTNSWSSPAFALSIDEIVDYDVLAFRNNGMVYKSVDYILNGSYTTAWAFSGFLFKDGSEIRIGSFMGDALYNDLSHIYGILYYTKS